MTGMRRAVPTIPVTPSMLRHFAVLTVAITGCLAMFADGENRQLIEDQLKARQAKNQALRADAQKGGKVRTVGGLRIAKGTKVDNSGGDSPNFASAPDSGGTIDPSGRYSQMGPPPPAAPVYGANPVPPGPPNLVMESDSSPGMPGFSRKNPKAQQAQQARQPTQEEIEAMMAASRSRAAGGSDSKASDPGE